MSFGIVQAEKVTTESGYSLGAGNATSFKNRLINPGMVIDQRNAGASVTPVPLEYQIDRWRYLASQSSKITMGQNQGSVTPPAGFTNYLGVTSSSAYSLLAADFFLYQQFIEGFNAADLGWGTANAKPATVSFWVRSSLTGTFGCSIQNNGNSRSYPFTYVINSANTWEYKTATIPGDTSGTWLTTNGRGIAVQFGLGVGSNNSGTADAWSGSDFRSVTGAVSVVSTNGATWQVTGVQFEVGTVATSFDFRSIGTELALCQRYYYRFSGGGNTRHAISGNGSLSQSFPSTYFKVTMRGTPTFSYSALSDFVVEGITGGGQATTTGISWNAGTTDSASLNCTSGGSGTAYGVNLLGAGSGAWTAYSAEL